MALPNQTTIKSAFVSLTEILQQWPDVDPASFHLLSQLEAGFIDLDNKLTGSKPNAQTLVMPGITTAIMI